MDLAILEAGILTVYGYHVETVPSGDMAISTLNDTIPDLVVLDLELSGNIHGGDILHLLRMQTPIPVLITSSSRTASRKYIRSSGETRTTLDHLAKPYQIHTFVERVKRMLPTPIIPS